MQADLRRNGGGGWISTVPKRLQTPFGRLFQALREKL